MKAQTIFKKVKAILCLCLTIVCMYSLFGCKSEKENPYEGKECIECGEDAEYSATSPTKPLTENEKSYKKLDSGSFYKIYYCEECWDKIPKASLKGN